VTSWVKDFARYYGKSMETFSFWELAFFCSRKLNFGIWKGDFLSRAPRRVLMCSLFLDTSLKKSRYLARGKAGKKFLCFRVYFRKINILVESWKSVEKRGEFMWELRRKRYLEFSRNVWITAIYGSFAFLFSVAFRPHLFKPKIKN
jgi:hypothetical protein